MSLLQVRCALNSGKMADRVIGNRCAAHILGTSVRVAGLSDGRDNTSDRACTFNWRFLQASVHLPALGARYCQSLAVPCP